MTAARTQRLRRGGRSVWESRLSGKALGLGYPEEAMALGAGKIKHELESPGGRGVTPSRLAGQADQSRDSSRVRADSSRFRCDAAGGVPMVPTFGSTSLPSR